MSNSESYKQDPQDRMTGGFCLDAKTLSDKDIFEAMKSISGYLDITLEDFKEVYSRAYDHARHRMLSLPAREIMTSPVHFVWENTSLAEVASVLAEKEISGLPVVTEQGSVAGIISEKDFLRHMTGTATNTFMGLIAECLGKKGCPAISVKGSRAMDIMTKPAVTVDLDTSLAGISELFTAKSINRVPVIDEQNQLVGIVSRDDIVRTLLPG